MTPFILENIEEYNLFQEKSIGGGGGGAGNQPKIQTPAVGAKLSSHKALFKIFPETQF